MKSLILLLGIVTCLSLLSFESSAQATVASNNTGAGRYLGFNAGQNLEFRTNNVIRMQLMQTGNTTINGNPINRSGFLGLSTAPSFFTSGSIQSPFSLLHLNGDNPSGAPETLGYRPWMRTGIVYTHNNDIMYIGPRAISPDVTDAVIAWGDNSTESQFGPDNLTFIYTSGTGTGSGASSSGGLEVARMTTDGNTGIGTDWSNNNQPKRTLDVVLEADLPQMRLTRINHPNTENGIYTDFQVSNIGHLHIYPRSSPNTRNVAIGFLPVTSDPSTNPTQRLDVRGTARLRQMPTAPPNAIITGVEESTAGDYTLNYLAFTGSNTEVLSGAGTWIDASNIGCEWDIVPNTITGNNDLEMGYPGACNEGFVKIGNPVSVFPGGPAKAQIANDENSLTTLYTETNGGINGIYSWIDTDFAARGHLIRCFGGPQSVGVFSVASSASGSSIGVAGIANSSGQKIGIYGQGGSTGNSWAGYFAGPITANQIALLSDANFKTNFSDEVPGIDLLSQLNVKSYEFRHEEYPDMQLPTGTQYGLIAQEVQELLPNQVREASKPDLIDEQTGEVISEGTEHLVMDYISLIPILIKSVQEQQALIQAQQQQIEALTNLVNDCCASDAKNNQYPVDAPSGPTGFKLDIEQPTLDQNVPNPFTQTTTVTYRLPEAAFARLKVVDARGMLVQVITEGSQATGEYKVMYDGSALAPGTYFFILEVNGQEIVKRAIKMNA